MYYHPPPLKVELSMGMPDVHFKVFKKWRRWSTFGRWGRQKVHRTLARARFHIKLMKNWRDQSSPKMSALLMARGRWSIQCDAPAMRESNRLWQNTRSKAWVMLRRSWQAGLQLKVAKSIVTVARKVVFFTIVLLLCYFAELKLDVAKHTVLASRREELICRS